MLINRVIVIWLPAICLFLGVQAADLKALAGTPLQDAIAKLTPQQQAKLKAYETARAAAYKASLLPLLNMFFAVGLVSLPGMMTGQILSGVDPLVAVRYQIMVMCMLFGSGGIAAAVYLSLLKLR